MTLNITVATPRVLVATTDRRLTNLDTGAVVTERSTKLTVLEHPSGIALISYNGIGRFQGLTPADWLLELAGCTALPELSLAQALECIRSEADRRMTNLPAGVDRRHTFVLGAWESNRTSLYVVSNYERADSDGAEPRARERFITSVLPQARGRDVRVLVTGATNDLNDADARKIMTVASRAGAAGIDVKNLCVKTIVRSSDRRRRRGTIGASVLWAVAELGRAVTIGLDVPGGTTVDELPNLIQRGVQFKGIMIARGAAGSLLWDRPTAPAEAACSRCGEPVPLGYAACGVCKSPSGQR